MPSGGLTVGAIASAAGALVCFFGFRLLRVTLALLGFAVGALLAGVVAAALGAGTVLLWIVAVLFGILGAILAALLYKIGLFLLGGGAGLLIAALVATAAIGRPAPLWLAGGGIAGGVLTLLIQRPLVSLLTAFLGAYGVVIGIAQLLRPAAPRPFEHYLGLGSPLLVAVWLGLGIVGALVQLATGRKRR